MATNVPPWTLSDLQKGKDRTFSNLQKAVNDLLEHQRQHLNPKKLHECLKADYDAPGECGQRVREANMAASAYYKAVKELWNFERKMKKGARP